MMRLKKKQLQKWFKKIVTKRIEIKCDRWKYWIGMKLKTILNLINYFKYKKLQHREQWWNWKNSLVS